MLKLSFNARLVVAELPEDDTWPPLCKVMFSVTGPDSLHGSFRGSRLIHFAGHINHLGGGLEEWLDKFERLLRRLIWTSATVFLLETWSAQEVRLSYSVGPDAINGYLGPTPSPPDQWEFSGVNLTPPEARMGGDFLADLLSRRAGQEKDKKRLP
jgi:hypothetical protein